MELNFGFLLTSIALGIGLAMDAFSVSLANGLNEPKMSKCRMTLMAGMFGGFQGLMPMIGWTCVHTICQYFKAFEKFIPWIALVLLLYIGGKMLLDGLKGCGCEEECGRVGFIGIVVQAVATSIDALSVGFTIAEYGIVMAIISALIIAALTFVICFCGIGIGKRFGTKMSNKASVFGGVILILIGIEIFVTGVFF